MFGGRAHGTIEGQDGSGALPRLIERRMLKAKSLTFGLCAVCGLGWSAGCGSATSDKDAVQAKEAPRCISPEESDRMADQVLELINLERTSADPPIAPVTRSTRLTQIADDYACLMIEEGFFGHRHPITGRGPRERAIAGKYYFFYAVGENLAAGQETPVEVMKVWMESPSHAAIILDPAWRQVGVGVRAGGEDGIHWVLEFGDPAD